MSEAVFNTNGGNGALQTSDFTFSISGGAATLSSATPTSISISGNVYTLLALDYLAPLMDPKH